MGSVTPTVVAAEGYVRVEVNWQDFPHARMAWIYRTVAGVRTTLRGGKAVRLSNGIAVIHDHEMPLDVPVTYSSSIALNYNGNFEEGVTEWTDTTNSGSIGVITQSYDYYYVGEGVASARIVRPPVGVVAFAGTTKLVSEFIPIAQDALNANPGFEVNAADWTGSNGAAISRDITNVYAGTGSGLIIPDGVTANPTVVSGDYAVTAGNTYNYFAWLRVSSGGSLARVFGIRWLDGSHAFLSDSTTSLTPTPTVWTNYAASAVAPVGAQFARLITSASGVLAVGNTWRIDNAVLIDPNNRRSYTLTGQLLVPDYWTGGIGVQTQWYTLANDGTNTLLGTTGALNDLAPFPGVFQPHGFSAPAFPGANAVKILAGMTGSPPETMPMYVDELYLTTSGTTVTAADVVVPSDNAGWWVDPLHPATKIRLETGLQVVECIPESAVGLVSLSEESFPADSEVSEVNNAVRPVSSWQVRKSGRQTIQVVTITDADRDQLKALHASGAPLLLQLPEEYDEDPAYQQHGDVSFARLTADLRRSWRVATSTFVKVAPPVGPAEGTWNTRYVDLDKYTTYGAATSAGVTWLDAVRGNLAV